jgi:hypothetical protein
MAATETVFATKAAFEESGLAPYLTTTADSCSICLKDLACEASGADYKPLSKAERAVLDDEVDTYQDISDIHHHRPQHHHHHHQEEQVGARLNACGHVFGKTCIVEWLKEQNTCPMCRIQLFPQSHNWYNGWNGGSGVREDLLSTFWGSGAAE